MIMSNSSLVSVSRMPAIMMADPGVSGGGGRGGGGGGDIYHQAGRILVPSIGKIKGYI